MTLSTTFSDINSLDDIAFVAGSSYTLKFVVQNQSGSGIDISGATCTWRMAPYGTTYTQLTKTGSVIATDTFAVYLGEGDTSGSSGKFAHQPMIKFSTGVVLKPAQGIITLIQDLQ